MQAVGDQEFITLLNPASTGGSVRVTAAFADGQGHPVGHSVVDVGASTRQTIVANTALGRAAAGPFSVTLTASGAIEEEAAQYYGGSPNAGWHPGVSFPALAVGGSSLYLPDLATHPPGGIAIDRAVYIYNPGASPIRVDATYYGSAGPAVHAVYSVPAGGIATADVNHDAGTLPPAGGIGVQLNQAAGSSGDGFMAYGVGVTADTLSATEDVGVPSP